MSVKLRKTPSPAAALMGLGALAVGTAIAAPLCAAAFLTLKPLELLARALPKPPERPEVWEVRRAGAHYRIRTVRTVPRTLRSGQAAGLAKRLAKENLDRMLRPT